MVGDGEQEISLGENLGGYFGDFEYEIRVLGYGLVEAKGYRGGGDQ